MRGRMRVDLVSLGAGVVIAFVGSIVLLDTSGALDVSLGWIAVVLTAAIGSILLLGGLVDGGPSRHD
jgi:hypothetical protein